MKSVLPKLVIAILLSGAAFAQARKPAAKPAPAAAEPASRPCPFAKQDKPVHRIVLKDGSYQPANKCELIGDRVHYLSAERFEWEDIPATLIDWDATRKYETEQVSEEDIKTKELDAEEKAEQAKEDQRSPQVAPGLRLPDTGGVWLMDTWRGDPQLIELVQNGADINKNTGRNILRAAINPLAKAKQSIEVKGAHARVQSHVPEPELYVNIDQDNDPATGPAAQDVSQHFKIVKLESHKDSRVVGNIEIAIYGKVSQKAEAVPTRATVFSGDWVRLVPTQPLAPGEYAVVEILGKDVNLYVWDFGVNPSAPQNDTAWHPAPVQQNKMGTSETPVLKKPKKQ